MNEKTKLNQMIEKQNEDFKKLEDEKTEVSQCFYGHYNSSFVLDFMHYSLYLIFAFSYFLDWY